MTDVHELVGREVKSKLTLLVAALAESDGAFPRKPELDDLIMMAIELQEPIFDFIGAAAEHGAKIDQVESDGENSGKWIVFDQDPSSVLYTTFYDSKVEAAEAYCDYHELDPDENTVYEHWAVSEWLAERLLDHGEKVVEDFAGLCVWARTSFGQAIALDGVIRKIAAEDIVL